VPAPADLTSIGLVDHHAHGILSEHPRTLDEFRGLFSESADPRQWPHVATAVSYRRAIGELAASLGCEPNEEAVFERRLAEDPEEYASALLQRTGTELLLVDDGFPPAGEGSDWRRMGELAGCRSLRVLRIESRQRPEEEVRRARGRGFAALKTIAAYRGGLRIDDSHPLWRVLEANEETGDPLPVQVHCGFGDADLLLPLADPGWLKPVLERFGETAFVLLHCYPFVREAGWLAHVYPNVFFDLSLTIPHVARPAEAVREALELAPVSKLLYASDAARAPELYLLAARRWREALTEVLPELDDDPAQAARMILRENALALYRV
jgi:predicted TIM-barrel fold metal-dependent hydrolase